LPGGRRPYVRAPLPPRPATVRYDREEEALYLDEGRISPVPPEAWDHETGGMRVLEQWLAARTAPAPAGTLAALRPSAWPQQWTSELLELITVLALLAELRPQVAEIEVTDPVTTAELTAAGVLPVPERAHRPASVLDHQEEGPAGQFTLL
ncbi:type ISP restriction/modification enzyme, partial [Streptomyces albogriseolus]